MADDHSNQQLPEKKGKLSARVEFISIKGEVSGSVEKGYSNRAIYNFFIKKDVITMGYVTFCNYMKKLKQGEGLIPPIKKATNTGEKRKNLEKDTREKKEPVIIGGEKEPEKHTDIDGMKAIFGDKGNN